MEEMPNRIYIYQMQQKQQKGEFTSVLVHTTKPGMVYCNAPHTEN